MSYFTGTVTNYDPNKSISTPERTIASPVKYGAVTLDTNFPSVARAIYVGVSGNLSVRDLEGNDVVFTNVPSGIWFVVTCTRVNTTGTSASGLIWGS